MTFKYDNVYIYYDATYDDFYSEMDTFEQAESKMIEDSVSILLSKVGKTKFDIDLFISGDLLNQLVSSNYAASNLSIPFMGVYNACATSVEGLIIASNMVESKQIKNCICAVSSHMVDQNLKQQHLQQLEVHLLIFLLIKKVLK